MTEWSDVVDVRASGCNDRGDGTRSLSSQFRPLVSWNVEDCELLRISSSMSFVLKMCCRTPSLSE